MAKSIMIIDDSVSIRKVLSLTLKSSGYEIIEAEDGQDALDKLDALDGELNLIICDVNMPRMDGLTFARTIKSKNEFRFIPIIMLTTESGEDKKEEGMEAGVRAWVTKPFQPQQMISAVSRLIT